MALASRFRSLEVVKYQGEVVEFHYQMCSPLLGLKHYNIQFNPSPGGLKIYVSWPSQHPTYTVSKNNAIFCPLNHENILSHVREDLLICWSIPVLFYMLQIVHKWLYFIVTVSYFFSRIDLFTSYFPNNIS